MTTTWKNRVLRQRTKGTAVLPRNRFAGRSIPKRDRICEVDRDETDEFQALMVMVVADTAFQAERLAEVVRQWGHNAVAFCNGIGLPAYPRPDVLMVDIESMSCEALQPVRQLRSQLARPDCLILALIRSAGGECHQMCLEAGVDVVLVKPLAPAVIETLLLLECTRNNRRPGESVRLARS